MKSAYVVVIRILKMILLYCFLSKKSKLQIGKAKSFLK